MPRRWRNGRDGLSRARTRVAPDRSPVTGTAANRSWGAGDWLGTVRICRPQTRLLCCTTKAIGTPYVTRADAGDALVEQPRAALEVAFADPELAWASRMLLLARIEVLPLAAYQSLAAFERLAEGYGYPQLR